MFKTIFPIFPELSGPLITDMSRKTLNSHFLIFGPLYHHWPSSIAQTVKNPPTVQETWVQSLGWEDTLEKEMATHSSILAWRIPWTEEPGGLQFTGSQRVGHDWATFSSLQDKPGGSDGKRICQWCGRPGSIPGLGRYPGEGNGYPLQYSCVENSMNTGTWWATVYGVSKS